MTAVQYEASKYCGEQIIYRPTFPPCHVQQSTCWLKLRPASDAFFACGSHWLLVQKLIRDYFSLTSTSSVHVFLKSIPISHRDPRRSKCRYGYCTHSKTQVPWESITLSHSCLYDLTYNIYYMYVPCCSPKNSHVEITGEY